MMGNDDVAVEMTAIPVHDGNHGEVFAYPKVFECIQHDAQRFGEDGMPAQSRANFGV